MVLDCQGLQHKMQQIISRPVPPSIPHQKNLHKKNHSLPFLSSKWNPEKTEKEEIITKETKKSKEEYSFPRFPIEEQHLEVKEKSIGVNFRNTFHDFENKKEINISEKNRDLVKNISITNQKARLISGNEKNAIQENYRGN